MTDFITVSYFLCKKSNESGIRMQRAKYLRIQEGGLVNTSNFHVLYYLNLVSVEKITCLLIQYVFRSNFAFNFQLKWCDKSEKLAQNIVFDILYVYIEDGALFG